MKKNLFILLFMIVVSICFAQMYDTRELKTYKFELSESVDCAELWQNIQLYFEDLGNAHITFKSDKTQKVVGRFTSYVYYSKGWAWILFDVNIKDNNMIVKFDVGSKEKSLDRLFSNSLKMKEKLEKILCQIDDISQQIQAMVDAYNN